MRLSDSIQSAVLGAGSLIAFVATQRVAAAGQHVPVIAIVSGVAWLLLLFAFRSLLRAIFAYQVQPPITAAAAAATRSSSSSVVAASTRGAVVITGTSSGIGRDAAVALHAAGFTVYCGVRRAADGEELAAMGLKPVILDVTSDSSVDAAAALIRSSLAATRTPLVALVNNAGVAQGQPLEMERMSTVHAVFDVNVYGTIRMVRAFLPLLRDTALDTARAITPRIVNVSSVNGRVSGARGGVYAATKFGVEALSDALRYEFANTTWGTNTGPGTSSGIAVAIVEPAYVKTRIAEKQLDDKLPWRDASPSHIALYKRLLDSYPAKRRKQEQLAGLTEHTTTPAILHAVTSPEPERRYAVSNAGGLPAWFITWVAWLLPDCAFDRLAA